MGSFPAGTKEIFAGTSGDVDYDLYAQTCIDHSRYRHVAQGALEDNSSANMYERFCGAQSTALQDVCKRVLLPHCRKGSCTSRLAIELSIEARLAERQPNILSEVEAAQREKEH